MNATDGESQTAMHWACVRGSLPTAECLLRNGARLDILDSRGYTPTHVAAQYGHTGMIYHFKTRWDADVDAADGDGRTPLHWAAYKGAFSFTLVPIRPRRRGERRSLRTFAVLSLRPGSLAFNPDTPCRL